MLLRGVFIRILFIESLLLAFSLIYRLVTQDATVQDLFWYSIRISVLVIIIIAFMMVTLQKFLTLKIIQPLEAIASANKGVQKDMTKLRSVERPENLPREIENIINTRSKMLDTILEISRDRLKYSTALQNELQRGKEIQENFLPRNLPEVKNCDTSSYFAAALQLSGDFYDMFELPKNNIGFVVGDVSGKGVGAALFMALVRSLLRIYSGSFSRDEDSCRLADFSRGWVPQDALKAVLLTNQYIAAEHGEGGHFVTLVFGTIDPETGKMFYINAGHAPLLVIDKNGIKKSLNGTGPALGPIAEAKYEIGSIQLEKCDVILGYTDGVTDARSENREFYTQTRLENIFKNGFDGSSDELLETIKDDLFLFTKNAPQSDDITMLAVKWEGAQI